MKYLSRSVVTAAVVALIVGFGIGQVTAAPRNARSAAAQGFAGRGASFMRRGNQASGSFLTGTVAKEDSGSITVDTRDGSSHLILITPATTVSKSVTGTMGDVSVGSNVIISGTTNSDGSVSATLVQLRPAGTTSANAPMIPAPVQPQ